MRLKCVLILLISTNFVGFHAIRKERAAPLLAKVATFVLEDLVSFALGSVLEELTDDENEYDVIIGKLDDIIVSLNTIQGNLKQIETLIQELKNRQTILSALAVEHTLRELIAKYQTVTKAIRAFDPSNAAATEQRQLLEKDIEELTRALKGIPGLLTKFHLMITGENAVAAGRLAGLACEYVESCLVDLREASAEDYDVLQTMNKIGTYKNSLMSLQVASFQLYNTTCAEYDLTCKENQKKLDVNLGEQEQRFKECTPSIINNMKSSGYSGFIKIVHETNHQVLYTKQITSIVRDGTFDWDQIDAPQDAGLRCQVENSPEESWSLIDARASGKGGYYMRQKHYCYLSYDQDFLHYEKAFPLSWTDGDRIDRNEFLICVRTLTSDAVHFLISADEAREDSSYTLRAGDKFLNVHIEKTSIHEKIDHRLVLVLFLDDAKSNSWKILPESSQNIKCDRSAVMSTPPLTCILHVDAHIQEPVRPFDSNTWQVIQGVAKYRLEKHSSSKYTTVCKYLRQLEAIDDLHGCHITCYRKFTAIPRENEKQNCKTITLRSKNPCVTATSSGIFENVCIFCRSTTKRNGKERERLGQCESHEAASNIKTAANILNDDELLTHIHDIDFISKEVKYHHSCRRLYLKKADTKSRSAEKTVGDSASSTHNRHDEAFRSVSTLIEEHVIEQKGAIYLTSLHQKYITLLGSEKIYTAQKVEEKLLVKYANYIKSTKLSNKKGKVIHAPHLSVEDATLYAEAYEKSTTAKLVDAALILRQQLLNQKDNAGDLELPLTNAIRKGNGNPPEDLITFFRTLFTGLSTKSVEGRCKAERHVQSVSNDVLYIVTNGVIKPAKHLTLAMGLKSITGSRKVVEILNHFGHCVGYHMVEMIETEVAETIQQSSSSLPGGLFRQAGLHTGTAWDNYDENTETLSGAGTLHDTFGICYQDIPNVRFGPEACESVGSLKPGKGKRSFQGKQHDTL